MLKQTKKSQKRELEKLLLRIVVTSSWSISIKKKNLILHLKSNKKLTTKSLFCIVRKVNLIGCMADLNIPALSM